jgi:hypothetical protein
MVIINETKNKPTDVSIAIDKLIITDKQPTINTTGTTGKTDITEFLSVESVIYQKPHKILLYETKHCIDNDHGLCKFCCSHCFKQCTSYNFLVYMYHNGLIKKEQVDRWWLEVIDNQGKW